MANLRELRVLSGLTQTQLGTKIDRKGSEISVYESGERLPELADIVQLEKILAGGKHIEFADPIGPKLRRELVQGLIQLSEKYPFQSALDFIATISVLPDPLAELRRYLKK